MPQNIFDIAVSLGVVPGLLSSLYRPCGQHNDISDEVAKDLLLKDLKLIAKSPIGNPNFSPERRRPLPIVIRSFVKEIFSTTGCIGTLCLLDLDNTLFPSDNINDLFDKIKQFNLPATQGVSHADLFLGPAIDKLLSRLKDADVHVYVVTSAAREWIEKLKAHFPLVFEAFEKFGVTDYLIADSGSTKLHSYQMILRSALTVDLFPSKPFQILAVGDIYSDDIAPLNNLDIPADSGVARLSGMLVPGAYCLPTFIQQLQQIGDRVIEFANSHLDPAPEILVDQLPKHPILEKMSLGVLLSAVREAEKLGIKISDTNRRLLETRIL